MQTAQYGSLRAAAALNFLSAGKLNALFFHWKESKDFKASGSLISSSPENGNVSRMKRNKIPNEWAVNKSLWLEEAKGTRLS